MPFNVIASLSSDCAKYYDQRLCLSACISQKTHIQTLQEFLRVLPVIMACFSLTTVQHVMVSWRTSCLHIMARHKRWDYGIC